MFIKSLRTKEGGEYECSQAQNDLINKKKGKNIVRMRNFSSFWLILISSVEINKCASAGCQKTEQFNNAIR